MSLSLLQNVFRRGSAYYFRARVPERLRSLVTRKELWRSLRTSQAGEARCRGILLLRLTERLWRDLERAMTPSEAKKLIDAWLRARLDDDADLRDAPEGTTSAAVVFRRTEPWLPDVVVERWDETQLATLMVESEGKAERLFGPGEYGQRHLTDREIATQAFRKPLEGAEGRHWHQDDSLARPLLRAILAEAGQTLGEDDPGFLAALRMLLKAQADLARAVLDRDSARWRRWSDDDPAQALLDRLSSPQPSMVAPAAHSAIAVSGTVLSDAEAAYLIEEVRSGQSQGRIKDFKAAFRTFRDWLQRDPDVADITPQVAGDYRIALSGMPANAGTRPEYRNLAIRERIDRAREIGDPRLLSPTTIGGKYIDPLRGLFEWARTTGKISNNPFGDIRPPKTSRTTAKAQRAVFTVEQLNRLFAQPLFTGAAAARGKPLYRVGPVLVDDWRYWVPLIALYSGARLNEICGLYVGDFAHEDGVPFFHVRPDAPDKRVKTEAGVRRVPIHSELVALGLLDRVERLGREGETRLFPNLRPGPRGYLSDIPSKFFADLIDRAIGKDASVVFHSFRHTFITRLRAARVEPFLRMAIVGHDPGETHEGYGDQDIGALSAEVQKVSYPGLDLGHARRET